MKQMDECLDRFFEKKPRLKKKWQAIQVGPTVCIFHYHHLVLVFDLENLEYKHEWWEKEADKRGLDAAKIYLNNKFKLNKE